MNISIVSVFKELYEPFLHTSLLKRAQENNRVQFDVSSLFDFVGPKQRIDAPSFGPGAGMLIKPEVVQKAIEHQEGKYGKAFKVFFSPHGKKLDQRLLEHLAQKLQENKHMMLLPARYEGMDARVEQKYADEIISVGDFVLMGGDIPAMMLLEGMLRLVPGIVGKQESIQAESFTGPFVDYPEFTEPVDWQGVTVPEIVRSGNHAAIEKWRQQEAAQRTVMGHFNWMRTQPITPEQQMLIREYIPHHYVALMHDEVMVTSDQEGTSSVMSIDIHDIARSSKTYGVSGYFLITPLKDQQKIVSKFLNFWQEGDGVTYRQDRHRALSEVSLQDSLDQAIDQIEQKEGKKPLLIATSARPVVGAQSISYFDQATVWNHKRPVLFVFGTARGLSQKVLDRCDYILLPLEGLTDFNHLSVRSAAGIILDRWLGKNPKIALPTE